MDWYKSEHPDDPMVAIANHHLVGRVRYDRDQPKAQRYRAWLPWFGTISGHSTANEAQQAVIKKWHEMGQPSG